MTNTNTSKSLLETMPRTVALAAAGNPTAIALLRAAYDRQAGAALARAGVK